MVGVAVVVGVVVGVTIAKERSKVMASFKELKSAVVRNFERRYSVRALVSNRGNVSKAARKAGLDRSNFLRMLRRYGIEASSYRRAK